MRAVHTRGMLQARQNVSANPRVTPTRTALSHAFEAFYRTLPVESGLIPSRATFRPERAGKFLKHLVLCEVVTDGLRMRLVGGAVEQRIQRSVTGQNYLDYLLPAFHAAAMVTVREIVTRPCGLWQVQPMLFAGGHAQPTELTVLPLRQDGAPLLLVLTQPMESTAVYVAMSDKMIAAGSMLGTQFIDLGAGLPG